MQQFRIYLLGNNIHGKKFYYFEGYTTKFKELEIDKYISKQSYIINK